jgi:hypothetical protein
MSMRKILDPDAPVDWPRPPIDKFPHTVVDQPHLSAEFTYGDDRVRGWTVYSNAKGDGRLKYNFEVIFNLDDSVRETLITLSNDDEGFDPLRPNWTGKETLNGLQPQWRKDLRQHVERVAVYLRGRNRVENAWLLAQFETIRAARRIPITNRKGGIVGFRAQHDAGWLITQYGGRQARAQRLLLPSSSS